jgi:hypothetical protein
MFQPIDDQHGRIHQSPDTMIQLEDAKQTAFIEGGGGGGGATFIFRVSSLKKGLG